MGNSQHECVSRQIHSHCVNPSCELGPESLRNVCRTLLNSCQEGCPGGLSRDVLERCTTSALLSLYFYLAIYFYVLYLSAFHLISYDYLLFIYRFIISIAFLWFIPISPAIWQFCSSTVSVFFFMCSISKHAFIFPWANTVMLSQTICI